jgi:hypothetical protein
MLKFSFASTFIIPCSVFCGSLFPDTFHEKAKSSVPFTDDLFYTSPDRHASIRTFVKGSPLPWCMLKSAGGAAI